MKVVAHLFERRPRGGGLSNSLQRDLRVWLIVAFAWLHGLASVTRAHDLPHSFQAYPPASSTLDPGADAALLRIRILDAKTREPTAATVSVNNGNYEPDTDPLRAFSLRKAGNRYLGAIRLRKIPYYFYVDGSCEV